MLKTIGSVAPSAVKRSSIPARAESAALQRTIFIALFNGCHYSFSLLLPRCAIARGVTESTTAVDEWKRIAIDRRIFHAGRQLTIPMPIRVWRSVFSLGEREREREREREYVKNIRKRERQRKGKNYMEIYLFSLVRSFRSWLDDQDPTNFGFRYRDSKFGVSRLEYGGCISFSLRY